MSPEPGFKVPHKVAFEYFKADIDEFAKKMTVTDPEILKQYEKNKEYYDQRYKRPLPKKPILVKPADGTKGTANETKSGPQPKPGKETGKSNPPADMKKSPTEPAKTAPKQPPKTEPKEPAKAEPAKGKSAEPPKAEPPKTEPKTPTRPRTPRADHRPADRRRLG